MNLQIFSSFSFASKYDIRRIESFIAKVIPDLKEAILLESKEPQEVEEAKILANKLLTQDFLTALNDATKGLLSKQQVNIFRTLLFHLKTTVDDFSNGTIDDNERVCLILKLIGSFMCNHLENMIIEENAVSKIVRGLEDLQDILKHFGGAILKRQYNDIMMTTFMNLSYSWAEIYILFAHFTRHSETPIKLPVCKGVAHLHSYLSENEWTTMEQRVENFGDSTIPVLAKLHLQTMRVQIIFQKNIAKHTVQNSMAYLHNCLVNAKENVPYIISFVNCLVPHMDKNCIQVFVRELIDSQILVKLKTVKHFDLVLVNAIVFEICKRLTKLFKTKRTHDGNKKKAFSSRVFSAIPEEIFFDKETNYMTDSFLNFNETWIESSFYQIAKDCYNELKPFFDILKQASIICSVVVQKCLTFYLLSLHSDLIEGSKEAIQDLEKIIMKIFENCNFPLTDVCNLENLSTKLLTNFLNRDVAFILMLDNVFAHENSIQKLEPLVSLLIKNAADPKYMNSCLLLLQHLKASRKGQPATKEIVKASQDLLIKKLSKLSYGCSPDFLEVFTWCLKHCLASEGDSKIREKLLENIAWYQEYCLENISENNKQKCVSFFTVLLQNKKQMEKTLSINEDLIEKIWTSCKRVIIDDKFSDLIALIIGFLPNEGFEALVKDVSNIIAKIIGAHQYPQLSAWGLILTCNVSAPKMKLLQEVLQINLGKLINFAFKSDFDKELWSHIIDLETHIIEAEHFVMSPALMDIVLITPTLLLKVDTSLNYEEKFKQSVTLLEALLKARTAMVLDRLPVFLQQYRWLLKSLSVRSDADNKTGNSIDVKIASICAFLLEKLTNKLTTYKKDMTRIAVFLIADILEQFVKVHMYPRVKRHLNNCVFSLVSLCDSHAISYLMRVLSDSSREIFKILFEDYRNNYMFTGKV